MHSGAGSEPVRGDKLVKVFRARRQFYDKHWQRPAAVLGTRLIDLAVITRMLATTAGPAARRRQWRAMWRARAAWRDPATLPTTQHLDAQEEPAMQQQTATITPGVRLRPRPVDTRARMEYRVLRHVQRSARSRDFDFVGQGLSTAVRIPLMWARDLPAAAERECNVCGWTGRTFYPNTGPGYHAMGVTCPGCSSLDRHRALLALLVSQTDMFVGDRKVVEVAPMRGFEALLMAQPDLDYVSFDLERHAMERGDITAMRYGTDSLDYFICFHVLEHIPDAPAALAEMQRVLRPGGTAVLQVPIDWEAAETREYDAPDPRDVGHVRQYGRDFGARVGAAGFDVTPVSVTDVLPGAVIERFGLSTEPIFFARKVAIG